MTTEFLYSVTYGNGIFVTVGWEGSIFTSSDGLNWTPQNSGSSSELIGVTYGNGLFIAVGGPDTILTSPNGITWTQQNSGTTNAIFAGVTYGNGVYVCSGFSDQAIYSKTIVTSSDGVTWTTRDIGIKSVLVDVTYGGGHFVAVGMPDTILSSPDSATWTVRRYDLNAQVMYYGVTYGNGTFVAVGVNGFILQTDPLGAGASGISGTVTANGAGLAGVTVTLSGPVSGVIVTAADGAYSFTGLPDGTYTVTPTLSGYAFSPASREVTVAGGTTSGQDFAAANQQVTLNLTISGSGSGTVRSTPAGIVANTSVSLHYAIGSSLTLNAEHGDYSIFTGWTGDCTGMEACTLTMDADKAVTAIFEKDTEHQDRLDDGMTQTNYYSILVAYRHAATGNIIRAWGTDFSEDFTFNEVSSVTLKGGYASDYNSNIGYTLLNGIMTIQKGSLTLENLVIR